MVYFCLSSASEPSSRCIINVENPPAHAQQRHEDNDFHLRCAPVITKSSAFFVSGLAFLLFRRLPQPHGYHCFSLMAVFIFYTTGSLENGADLHPPCVSLWPTAGDPVLSLPAGVSHTLPWSWRRVPHLHCVSTSISTVTGEILNCTQIMSNRKPCFNSINSIPCWNSHMEGCIKGAVCCTAPL